MAKRFNSVAEMVGELGDTPAKKKELVSEINKSQIASILFVLRNRAGLTQENIAEKTQWGQSKVSKIEHQEDEEFSIGDLAEYCKAVGFNLEIGFSLKSTTWVDKVKFHFFKMSSYLDKITDSAAGDITIQKGVNGTLVEASANLIQLTQACIGKIKPIPASETSVIISKPVEPVLETVKYAEKTTATC
jgi:transcriptional regulator with XRE-family HTH domain